jgi:hypothetical protein
MKKLIFATTVVVFAFSYATSLQAQTSTQPSKATTKATKATKAAPKKAAGPTECEQGRGEATGTHCNPALGK